MAADRAPKKVGASSDLFHWLWMILIETGTSKIHFSHAPDWKQKGDEKKEEPGQKSSERFQKKRDEEDPKVINRRYISSQPHFSKKLYFFVGQIVGGWEISCWPGRQLRRWMGCQRPTAGGPFYVALVTTQRYKFHAKPQEGRCATVAKECRRLVRSLTIYAHFSAVRFIGYPFPRFDFQKVTSKKCPGTL